MILLGEWARRALAILFGIVLGLGVAAGTTGPTASAATFAYTYDVPHGSALQHVSKVDAANVAQRLGGVAGEDPDVVSGFGVAAKGGSSVIVGENMARVSDYAGRVGGTHIDEWLAGRTWSPAPNDEFITTMKTEGRGIVNIGPDFGRRLRNRLDPTVGRPPSPIYGGERQQLRGYGNYRSVYERTGRYQGGVPGLD